MALLTIRGTLGSGASEIGNQIAKKLHLTMSTEKSSPT